MMEAMQVHFSGRIVFVGNRAKNRGGVVFANSFHLHFSGNTTFTGNTADYGGAVSANNSNTFSFEWK